MKRVGVPAVAAQVYPELQFGGFTRCDGTMAFTLRVQALLGPNQKVLDVGCGRGSRVDDRCELRRQLQDFRGAGRRVLGIDPDANAASNPFLDEFRLMQDVRRWPVEDASIDLLYADYVLEHVDDPAAFFGEVARVLRPGGHACFRTPNRWSYPSLAARLVPNRMHAAVTGYVQQGREARDVFPTFYRCNSAGRLRELFREHGLAGCAYTLESEPTYLAFSPLLYRIAARLHPLIPSPFRATLLGFARRA
jgi:SAM-dependent methyltransferase